MINLENLNSLLRTITENHTFNIRTVRKEQLAEKLVEDMNRIANEINNVYHAKTLRNMPKFIAQGVEALERRFKWLQSLNVEVGDELNEFMPKFISRVKDSLK